tara:strand:+ start:156 stop:782 length:627 start_codon:yes stop_codon:yes gene_type:complete
MADVERHEFFPTCLYRFKHNFKDNELNNVVKHIEDNSLSEQNGQVIKRTGSQTQDELHKIDTFSNLTKTIIDVSKTILDEQGYMGEIEITNMWGNILRPQSQRAHAPHSHSNNFLSGVFYIKTSDDTSPIQFFDPRPQSSVLKPRKSGFNILNSDMAEFQSEIGWGVVFPSWLVHWVPETKDERISIAWNVIVRGEYGEPNTLQNAHI